VVYATTEPSEALLLGGYTAVMHQGRVLQYGPTLEVFRQPQSLEVARAFSDPPINVLQASPHAGAWRLANGSALSLSGVAADAGPLQIGLRASVLRTQAQAGDMGLMGRVQLAEISGTDTFVHLDCGGIELVMQQTGVHVHDIGQSMTVSVNEQDAYVFDLAGGLLRAPLNLHRGGH
jgi:glycerol transport system ATP-binding protein